MFSLFCTSAVLEATSKRPTASLTTTLSSLRQVQDTWLARVRSTDLTQISVWIDNIEDIEEDPETSQILCTFEGKLFEIDNKEL